MKKIILLLLFLMTFAISVTAQPDFPYPELFSRDSIESLIVHNGQLIILKKDKKKNFLLSVNSNIDTLKVNIKYLDFIPMHNNTENNIYLQSIEDKSYLYKLDLDTKVFTKIKIDEYKTIYCILNNLFILKRDSDHNIYEYNIQTLKTDTLFDGGESFGITSSFLIGHKTLIKYWESGEVENFALFDFSNKQMIYPVEQLANFSYFDKANVNTYFRDVTEQYYNIGLFWVDEKFNVIQPTLLPYYASFASYNLNTAAMQSFCYRSSYIERKPLNNYVWLACKFSLPFDKALYDIYHNTLLEKTVIETFDEWELNKLRNMIFAKHGYQFKSEYLQAFFNLFDFYSDLTKTDDVSALLTPADKKNLALIQQVSKQK